MLITSHIQLASARSQDLSRTRSNSGKTSEPKESYVSQAENEPRPGLLKRMGRGVKKAASRVVKLGQTIDKVTTRAAFAAVPGLAGLGLQGLSDLVDKVPGQRADRVSSKLESLAARSKRMALGQVTELGSGIIETKFGPNISQLKGFERTLAEELKPRDGQLPDYLEELRSGQLREEKSDTLSPFSRFPAFVHLEGRPEASRELAREFHHAETSAEVNPYLGTELEHAWETLTRSRNTGQLPVFVDLDGNPGEVSPTEKIAAGMVASLNDRGASGDEFSSTPIFLESTRLRLEAHQKLDGWMKTNQPQIWHTVDNVKKLIQPMETGLIEKGLGLVGAATGASAPKGLQWRSDPSKLDTAYNSLLLPLAQAAESGRLEDQARWVDTVSSLDRDLFTGLQTDWMRLMKESTPEQRQSLFRPLVTSWLDLSLSEDQASAALIPDGTLDLPYNKTHTPLQSIETQPYNRGMAAGLAIDHLLDGAGIDERKQMISFIHSEIRNRDDKAQSFVDKNKTLGGVRTLPTPVQILDKDRNAETDGSGLEAYKALQTWIDESSERYFDPSELLSPELSGVSEFYSPDQKVPESVDKVMKLMEAQPPGGTPLTETFGQGEKTTKSSLVFAGGGGKGMVYTHQLKKLTEQLSASKNGKFEVDEIVGTSAGAITAGLLAAGFSPEELDTIMKEIDFSSFYSDYAGKQGGIDPSARGLDRSGIFSMRSMYETLNGLLSKKLGIEGRPVTFADLKPELKIVTRLTSTDLPEDSELQQNAGADGKFVFSKENTPHMDVAAALIASSAIPAFFDPPQMMVTGPDGKPGRMQFTDGGVLDNFAVSEASKEQKSFLAVIPNPSGDILTTDFAPPQEQLEAAHAMGDQLFQADLASSLVPNIHLLTKELEAGRVVFGMHLVKDLDGAADVTFQGDSMTDTEKIYKHVAAPEHVGGDGLLFPEKFMVEKYVDNLLTGQKRGSVRGIAGIIGGRGVQEKEIGDPENVLLSTARGLLTSPKERFQAS